ncbi:MAG: hypothetical protein IJN22_05305 [Clostridia bacterium]|nr:hypothetical protein [Clostridia bacterium]
MTKRLSSKLLAVILTLAICATTVFGCLMTVSADTSWITFSAGESTDIELTKASIELTVTLGDLAGFTTVENDTTIGGMMAGEVALSYGDNLTLTGVTVDTINSTKVDANYTPDANEFKGNGYIEFDSNGFSFLALNNDDVYYKSLTFKLDFSLESPAQNGDKMSVTASSATIAGGLFDATYEENTSATGIIVMGCDHNLTPVGEPLVTDTVNGYAVYSDSVCSKCDLHFGKQVVPTKLPGVVDTLVFSDAYVTAGSINKYCDSVVADNPEVETGDSWETAIIIDSAEELSYITQYAPTADTEGKYYKVADGIKGFDMSGGKINLDGTLDENFDAITGSGKNHNAPASSAFAGHFDGNGATVYGLWQNIDQTPKAAGLFPFATGDVTIKNVNVSLSYLIATQYAGGIVGAYFLNTSFADINKNQLTIEKCSVTECHIETTTTGNGDYGTKGTGAIYGMARCYSGSFNGSILVNNCFIDLDAKHFISAVVSPVENRLTDASIHGGIGGVAVTTNARFTNCVVIGITPYSTFNAGYQGTDVQHTGPAAKFTNIYTDAVVGSAVDIGFNNQPQDYTTCMTQLTTSQMKGTAALDNMTYLRWKGADEAAWEVDVNRGYPKFIQEETPDLVSDTSDYELTLIGTNITYNNGGDYNYNFYYRPGETYTSENISLYVAQLNDKAVNTDKATLGSFHRLTGEVLESSPVEGVQAGDIRFTIERLSAREIYNTLLATAVAVKDGEAFWGETDEFSVADYENAIINGAYDTDDKNLAEAVLKYGRASAAALNTKNDAASGTTIYWNGGTDSNLTDETHDYSTQTGDAANPIIIDSAEELAYLIQMPYTETQGRYYKIADGIDNIVLQKEEHDNGIMQLPNQSKVKEYFESEENSKTRWITNYNYNTPTALAFYGNFDGNGVTVYGLYGINGADSLFGAVMAPAVVKNITVRNCYIGGTNYGAFISSCVTLVAETSDEKNKNNFITFENIEISNCHFKATGVGNKNIGLLSGTHNSGANVTVNNLLVYGCEIFCTADNQVHTRLSGQTSWNNAATGIKNSVILDCSITEPYNSTYSGKEIYNYVNSGHTVENVYSSCPEDATRAAIFSKEITYITNEQAMGVAAMTNMDKLDWTNTWCYGDTYPSLAKGAYTSSVGKTLYWNGTKAGKFYADTDGASAANPIIINTAEELAYLATATYADTNGKYFKIADGIDKIVLQSETYGDDIIALDSATAVKNYFEPIVASDIAAGKATLHGWVSYTWKPENYCFSGNLDGNGVEIYGMYHSTTDINSTIDRSLHGGASGGGLFSVADNATISNLAIKNSYANLGSQGNTHANYSFGLIVAFGKDMNSTNNAVFIDRCTVANNYIYKQVHDNSMWRAGTICGGHEAGAFILQNCLVYGNDAMGHLTTADVDYKLGLVGGYGSRAAATEEYKAAHPEWVVDSTYMAIVLENSVVLGNPLIPTDTAGTTIKYSQWCSLNAMNAQNNNYKNVYTDWDIENLTNATSGNFIKSYFLANCGGVVNANDLIGDTAKANELVGIFNTDNGDTVWYTGNSALLGFTPPTEMLPSAQAVYDAITFTTADNYGTSDMEFGIYATSLNLKTNPYISFAFAFNGDYKRDRQNITVTFTYDGGSKTVDVVDESGALVEGWENPSNAGRYHIYRFQDIPVDALTSPITVTVAYNGIAVEQKTVTGSFSVEGFGLDLVNAYKKAPSEYYETRIEAVKALLFYTQMLQTRYGA